MASSVGKHGAEMTNSASSDRRVAAAALAEGILFLAAYSLTAAQTVQGLDSGEFITVAVRGGVPHPPGYPLFTLLCRFFCAAIPVSTFAYRTALVSSLMGAATLASLSAAAGIATGRIFEGLLVSVLLGLSPLFWQNATVPDVFAANAFAASASIAVVTYICTRRKFTNASFSLLGLTLAVGIANHHTILLMVPVYFMAMLQLFCSEESGRKKTVLSAVFVSTALLGLCLYAVLLFQHGEWQWGNPTTVSGLARHFLRFDYGTFRLSAGSASYFPWENAAAFLSAVKSQFSLLVVLPCLVGLCLYFVRHGTMGAVIAALLVCFALSGPLFLSMCNVEPQSAGKFVLERFFVLPLTILALLVGLGAGALVNLLKSPGLRRLVQAAIVAIPVILFAAGPRRQYSTFLEDYVANCLSHVKRNAVIVGSSDSELGGFLYVQQVLNRRRDVVFVAPPLLQFAWYRDLLTRQNKGFELPSGDGAAVDPRGMILDVVRCNTGRPVYLCPWYGSDSVLMRSLGTVIPSGGVLLEAVGGNRTDLPRIEKDLLFDFRRLTLRSGPASRKEADADVDYDAYLNYSRTAFYLARLFGAEGNFRKQKEWQVLASVQARPWWAAGPGR